MMASFKICVLLVALAIAGCQTSGVACPPIVTYSKDHQKKTAKELARIRKDAPRVAEMVDDYGKTRDAIRACQGAR